MDADMVSVNNGFPSGSETRREGVAHAIRAAHCERAQCPTNAPPSPEMTVSGLTESGLSGKIRSPNLFTSPALPDVRPAPQAGCFVSGLYVSKDSAQITLRHSAC